MKKTIVPSCKLTLFPSFFLSANHAVNLSVNQPLQPLNLRGEKLQFLHLTEFQFTE